MIGNSNSGGAGRGQGRRPSPRLRNKQAVKVFVGGKWRDAVVTIAPASLEHQIQITIDGDKQPSIVIKQ